MFTIIIGGVFFAVALAVTALPRSETRQRVLYYVGVGAGIVSLWLLIRSVFQGMPVGDVIVGVILAGVSLNIKIGFMSDPERDKNKNTGGTLEGTE